MATTTVERAINIRLGFSHIDISPSSNFCFHPIMTDKKKQLVFNM
jgi:hypothetical protein